MGFKIAGLAIAGAFIWMLPGVESDHAVILAMLPIAAIFTFFLLS
jgi:hypothetical protein